MRTRRTHTHGLRNPLGPTDKGMASELLESRRPVVLVAGGEEWSTRSIESVIAVNGYDVVRAHDAREVAAAILATPPDILFLNTHLNDASGIALASELRSQGLITASTPLLMVAPLSASHSLRLEALWAGAWDVFTLPLDPEILLAKLATLVRAKYDADHARAGGLLDSVSGLYNLQGILKRAGEVVNLASRSGSPVACVVFSVGSRDSAAASRSVGNPMEEARRQAQPFLSSTRGSDSVGRLGETEFVVLAPNTDRVGAQRLAERLVQTMERSIEPGSPSAAGTRTTSRLRVGCYAVSNPAQLQVSPRDLVVRATTAAERAADSGMGPLISFYEEASGGSPLAS